AQPYLRRSGAGVFEDPRDGEKRERQKFDAGIKCTYVDGRIEDVEFSSRDQLLRFWRSAHEARRSGAGAIELRGKSIAVDDSFVRTLDELVERVTPARGRKAPESLPSRRFLLIYTNENDLEYDEPSPAERADAESEIGLPKSLRTDLSLKSHQQNGIAWLQ